MERRERDRGTAVRGQRRRLARSFTALAFAFLLSAESFIVDAAQPERYFAHAAVEDADGVIAPWYRGLNGQCDFRVRIAAETLKRYPWADSRLTAAPAPHFVFNGDWSISNDGTIRIDPKVIDWNNGDVGQRSVSLIQGLAAYYRYSGDPAAIGLVKLTADNLLDNCLTSANHPWPRFPISCPTHGKAYGHADPHGFIQLDLSAQLGSAVLVAYKLTGDARYWEAVRHWADLLAAHCDDRPGQPPWNRYANPQDIGWNSRQTAGIALVLQFLDDMIRTGSDGTNRALVHARDVGDKYLREVLMPAWSADQTFGRNYWDWENATDTCAVPCYAAEYMMSRPEAFPNWKTDVRNALSLFFCRSSVDPASSGGVFSGAWAVPESSSCCGRSLQYPTMIMAASFARYGELANSDWAREIARREAILATYDARETGVVEDNIDGGTIVADTWFNLAHPWPLRMVLNLMAWQPAALGANRENHIMRTSSVVTDVSYFKGGMAYTTFDAAGPCEDLLRLSFTPQYVSADRMPLPKRSDLSANGFTVAPLANGDCIVRIRHDGRRNILIEGDDLLVTLGANRHLDSKAGVRASFGFTGNQVRVIGRVGLAGGKADVYLDGQKQLCGIDFWCPLERDRQVVYYKNGLAPGRHRLEIVALGQKNPRSLGTEVSIDEVQACAADGSVKIGEGFAPRDAQRVICGYVGRHDHIDSHGATWRPATEFTMRVRTVADLVPLAFWTNPRLKDVARTSDPELYRYGIHGRDFTFYFTVRPERAYHVTLKFCQALKPDKPGAFATNIDIGDKPIARDLDIAKAAGGLGRAFDLNTTGVRPRNGVIAVHFWNSHAGEAMIQAIEVAPSRD